MTGSFPFPAAAGFQWDPLTVERLPNGLTVVVKEDHAAPLAVTDVWFGVGSRQETDDQSGTAHFLEHMLFKGTTRRGPGEIAAEIEAFGGRTNAGTSIDYTHYYIACESHSLTRALEIHADIFHHAALDPAAIEAERGVILEEIKRAQDTPSRVLWDSLCRELFPRHPYRRPTLGTPETVRGKITPTSLREFFSTWYVPGNMAILVVGDVRTDEVLAQLRAWYGDLPAAAPPTTRLAPDGLWTGCRTVRQEMDVDRGYLQLAFRTVSHASPEEAVGLDLLGVVAGLGRTSRLSVALREQASLVSQVSAGQVTLIDDGMFLVRAEFDPADEDRVVEAIRAELTRLHREPLPVTEVQKAREYLENLYLRSVETAEGKSEVLGNAVVRHALDEERRLLALVRSFTPERLQELAVRHLAHPGHVLATLGPRPRFTELAAAPRRAAPAQAAGQGAPTAATALQAATSPVPHAVTPRAFRLDNGLRVVHQPVPGSGLVGICLAIDAGSRREAAGQSGISNLTAEMLFKGTARREGLRTLWDLESLGIESGHASEPDLLRLALGAPAARCSEALDILADVTRHATFPAEAFGIESRKVLARLRSIPDNLFENTWRLFHATLYKSHPYGNHSLGTQAEVERLTPADLRAFAGRWFTPGRMVLALVGDLGTDEAVRLASRHFGQGHPAGPAGGNEAAPTAAASPAPPATPLEARDHRSKAQAMLCLGWLGPAIGHPDYVPMKVLNAVFGGGMGARLFRKVRNEASLAYMAQAVFPSRIDGGAFCAIVGTAPASVGAVRDIVLAEVRDIAEHGIPDAERERAVAYVAGQFALDHAASLRQAHYLSWFELIGAGFSFDQAYLGEVRQVTGDDLQRVARTYLDPARAVLAVTGPAPTPVG